MQGSIEYTGLSIRSKWSTWGRVCTQEHVKQAKDVAAASRTDETHVVFAPSLDRRHRKHRELFENQGRVKGLWNTKQYLRSFINDELDRYRERLTEERPEHYIRPRVSTPSGFVKKLPDPLESVLLGRGEHDENPTGILGVLLAEPGQGKTCTTQYLATQIANRDLVPIYINSSQWDSLSLADLESLDKTLTHCFRHFGSSISWLDGHEDEFVRVTLKAGVFAIILDGFDEYILWNKGQVKALDVLLTLGNLTKVTGAGILITSRTSFLGVESL